MDGRGTMNRDGRVIAPRAKIPAERSSWVGLVYRVFGMF